MRKEVNKIGDNDGLWVRISCESYRSSRNVEIFTQSHKQTQGSGGIVHLIYIIFISHRKLGNIILDIIEPTIGVFICRGQNQTASQPEPRERVVSPTMASLSRDILTDRQ